MRLDPQRFLNKLHEAEASRIRATIGGYLGKVVSVSGTDYESPVIRPNSAEDTEVPAAIPRAAGPALYAGDPALVLTIDGNEYALPIGGETYGRGGLTPAGGARSARFISLQGISSVGPLSAAAVTADRLYYVPFYVPARRTIDAVQFEVVTAVSGFIICGIYDNVLTTIEPDDLIATTARTSATLAGKKTYTLSSSVELRAGHWYWIGILCTTAQQLLSTTIGDNLPNLMGWSDSGNITDRVCLWYEDIATGWSALPSQANPSVTANRYIHIGARYV